MREKKYFKVRSTSNGGLYTIGEALLKSGGSKWELVEEEKEEEELSYFDLKAALTDLDVSFKGNASKSELMKLYRSAINDIH